SAFMICVNELTDLKCNNKTILESLLVLLSPFAPHIAEELWQALGQTESIADAQWPSLNEDYLKEDQIEYPVSFNGKMRFKIELPADMPKEDIEKAVMAHETAKKWLDGKAPKKIIVVPKRIINVVI
ncbi:MAG: class I tRNA ligase family protein, partial [Bacteroidetes bacterium]|nr:class I tRNA ligase family protein [Bacteroidota bacterium]